MANYYISPSGNDFTGTGSEGNPWISLKKATDTAVSGDTIMVLNGSYIETNTSNLRVGVNIKGNGRNTTFITSNIPNYLIRLISTNNEQGNQYISDISFDGSGLTATSCIYVSYRGGVTIKDCSFSDFYSGAVSFVGYSNPENKKIPPTIWITNNKFINNITNNNSQFEVWPKNLWITGQDGIIVSGNTMVEDMRGSNQSICIGSQTNRRMKISNNILTRGAFIMGNWHFAMELRYNYGEIEIFDNIIDGESDITYIWKENLEYGLRYYNNIVGPPAPTYSGDVGLQLEAQVESVEIYNNVFKGVYAAFYIASTTVGSDYAWNHVTGVTFRNNLCYDMAPWVYPWNFLGNGIYFVGISSTTWENIFIYNNTFISVETGTTSSQSGIRLQTGGSMNVCKIKNNIFHGFRNAFLYVSPDGSEIVSINSLEVFNNISYGCGNSNNPSFVSITLTNYTSGNTIKLDPLLIKPSYYPSANSPAINAGTYVGLPYSGPAPDIGAFETSTTYYLSPNGNDYTNNGLSIESPWFSLNKAWNYIVSGDTILMSGGTYIYTEMQTLKNKSGNSNNMIKVFSRDNETVVITCPYITDYTNWKVSSGQACLINFVGDYVHFKGFHVSGFTQNYVDTRPNICAGFLVTNSNNCLFEQLKIHNNGCGLYILADPILTNYSGNIVLNSDFYQNYDPYGIPPTEPYGNAQGVTYAYGGPLSANYITGCRAWNNSDQGILIWRYDGIAYIDKCWSFSNGYREDGITMGGNGPGFKLGSCETYTRYNSLGRVLTNCVSAFNYGDVGHGFDHNLSSDSWQKGTICYLYNNISYANKGHGFIFANGTVNTIPHVAKNNISYGNTGSRAYFTSQSTVDHNTFNYWNTDNSGYTVSDSDFQSLDKTQMLNPRKENGDLPDIAFLHLTIGSDLINTGVDVGYGDDLGPFQYELGTRVVKIFNKVLTKNGKILTK